MKNVELKLNEEKTELVITIDLTKTFGLSKSLKSKIIATTSGNKSIGIDGVKLGLNLYKPA